MMEVATGEIRVIQISCVKSIFSLDLISELNELGVRTHISRVLNMRLQGSSLLVISSAHFWFISACHPILFDTMTLLIWKNLEVLKVILKSFRSRLIAAGTNGFTF